MASDLLSTISSEIDARLREMRPLIDEYQQLLVAADALIKENQASSAAATRAPRARKGDSAKPAKPTKAAKPTTPAKATKAAKASASDESAEKPARAARGAAREAVLAALEHGSHTISELVVVTAMSTANINGNVRRLQADGLVAKTEREGKTAWALAGAA